MHPVIFGVKNIKYLFISTTMCYTIYCDRRRKMLKKFIIGIILTGIVLTALFFGIKRYLPGFEKIDPLKYFDEFKEDQINLVFEDKRIALDKPVMQINGNLYLSFDFAKKYVDPALFYDEKEEVVTITTKTEVLRLYVNSRTANRNFQQIQIEEPVKQAGGICYLPYSLLNERYGLSLTKGKDGRLYVADNLQSKKTVATVRRKTELRTHPDIKAMIVDTAEKGSKVTLYSKEGNFYRARNENGFIGYLPASSLKDIKEISPEKLQTAEEQLPLSNPLNEKVRLVWDQLGSKVNVNFNDAKYTGIQGANVIAPTWFEFQDESGTLIDRATRDYVLQAHNRGLKVWALMSHNFDRPELTKQILTSTQKRQYVISQIAEKSQQYGFDGINIDIENIQAEFSDEWVQFMRELYPQLRELGLTVSVDVYVPSNWSTHYERGKISEVVDYFIVMAYDEHWSGSKNAGSVASLPWVEEGIINTLKEVPKEKLVLGIPFYTRIWEESEQQLKSSAYSMKVVEDIISRWGIEPVYDENTGQYYVEREKNNILYKVWIENEESIKKRVDLINQYDLQGYACWKLGLETEGIWYQLGQVQ